MWLAKVSSGIDENLFASYFCWIAGNSHTWVLEELSGGHVILPAVPRTGDNCALERPLAQRPSPVQASVVDSEELACDVRKCKSFARDLEFVNGARWNIGSLGG
jgi:hypothetical protein